MKFSLINNIIIGFFLICTSVILLASATYKHSRKYNDSVYQVEHTQQILFTSECILSNAQNLQTTTHTFVLTNRPQFLVPFSSARKMLYTDYETLRKLVADNPAQVARVNNLDYLLKEKIAFAEAVIRKRREVGFEEAKNLIAEGTDLTKMEQIRLVISQLQAEENQLLKIRKDRNNKNIAAFNKTFTWEVIGIVLAVVISLVLIFLHLKSQKKARDLLSESQQMLQSIIDNTTSLIYIKDLKGRFVLVNRSYEKLLGLTKDEIVGKTNFELFPRHIAAAFQEADDKVLTEKQTVEAEEKGEFNNELQYYISIKSPLYHSDGSVYAVCGISTDITEMKKQANLIHDLYDNSPCGYYSINKAGKFIDANKTFLKWSGFKREELLGKSHTDVLCKEDIAQFEQNFSLLQTYGRVTDVEYTYVRKDQSLFNGLVSSSAVLDEKNGFRYSRSSVFDITERKKLETELKKAQLELQSIEWFKLAGQATADAMWDWDLKSGRLMWGEGFETLFNYKINQMEPTIDSWLNNIHPDDKERVVKHLYEVINSETETKVLHEYRFTKADNTFAYVLDKGIVLRDKNNKPYRMVGALQDITAFRKNIEDLQQFSFITSHNFRAPLANLLGILDLMNYSTLDEYNKQLVEMIRTSTSQLKETIDHLSQVLVIKNKQVELQDVDITKLVEKVKADLNDEIEKIKPEIYLQFSIVVIRSNQYYLESILQNLFTNSLKYRSPDRQLVIRITTEKTSRDRTLITFSDNGLGIENRHMNKLFGMYQRFHNISEGKGLGLFLIKSQITALGGSIEVQSEVNKGTIFSIIL